MSSGEFPVRVREATAAWRVRWSTLAQCEQEDHKCKQKPFYPQTLLGWMH
jgi:hypothetical protein